MRRFKNDKERREFLDNHYEAQGFKLWKADNELSRRWWRCEIADNLFLVVEEHLITRTYPEKRQTWEDLRWYLTPEYISSPFSDMQISKTQALDKLKELDRKARE